MTNTTDTEDQNSEELVRKILTNEALEPADDMSKKAERDWAQTIT